MMLFIKADLDGTREAAKRGEERKPDYQGAIKISTDASL